MVKKMVTRTKQKRKNRATPNKARRSKRRIKVDEAAVIHQNIYAAAPYDERKSAATE